ncbi:hypothetical protein JHK87_014862 [Glycine soja]|nr:hypothetical protein JHK87_014862 [Glycine soja]
MYSKYRFVKDETGYKAFHPRLLIESEFYFRVSEQCLANRRRHRRRSRAFWTPKSGESALEPLWRSPRCILGFTTSRRDTSTCIFPPLNFPADPPVQNLLVTDVHGFVWEFRHIYRGTPRRHLLTTGWSTFVNNKKLVAGDAVVFMKNSRGGLLVGIRRTTRFSPGKGGDVGTRIKVDEEEEEEEEVREVFSRDGRGKLSAKVVAEAAELAARSMPFEVVYYPKGGWSEFVVKTEAVNEAMSVEWSPGMKVKIATETDDSSRVSWCQGTEMNANVKEAPQMRILTCESSCTGRYFKQAGG